MSTATLKPFTRLADLPGVAGDVGDLFLPKDCRDGIVARVGKIRNGCGDVVPIVLVAHDPPEGPMQLQAKTLVEGRWIQHVAIGSGGGLNDVQEIMQSLTEEVQRAG